MVAKSDLLKAAQAIERALEEFVHNNAAAKVFVFETEWGHLCALVGSGGFQGKNVVERLDTVWDYLRQHVSHEDLKHLSRVEPMDLDEYDVRTAGL